MSDRRAARTPRAMAGLSQQLDDAQRKTLDELLAPPHRRPARR